MSVTLHSPCMSLTSFTPFNILAKDPFIFEKLRSDLKQFLPITEELKCQWALCYQVENYYSSRYIVKAAD